MELENDDFQVIIEEEKNRTQKKVSPWRPIETNNNIVDRREQNSVWLTNKQSMTRSS